MFRHIVVVYVRVIHNVYIYICIYTHFWNNFVIMRLYGVVADYVSWYVGVILGNVLIYSARLIHIECASEY